MGRHLALAQVQANLDYFAANYLALGVLIACMVCMYYPSFLFFTAVIAGGWYAALFLEHRPITILERQFSRLHKTVLMAALSMLIVIVWCAWQLFLISILSVLFTALHAWLRESRVRAASGGCHDAQQQQPLMGASSHDGTV